MFNLVYESYRFSPSAASFVLYILYVQKPGTWFLFAKLMQFKTRNQRHWQIVQYIGVELKCTISQFCIVVSSLSFIWSYTKNRACERVCSEKKTNTGNCLQRINFFPSLSTQFMFRQILYQTRNQSSTHYLQHCIAASARQTFHESVSTPNP